MSNYGYAEFFANYIDQILELVVDEDLEDEIEQADIFRERLQRAIMDAENSTEVKRHPSTRSAATLDSLVITSTSICIPSTLSSALSSPVTTTRPPVVSVTYGSVGLPPFDLPIIPSYGTIGTLLPGVYTTTASSPRAVVTLLAADVSTPMLPGHVATVKLPKLTLKRFNRDVM